MTLHRIALHCVALHCIALHSNALYCIQYTTLHYITYCIIWHYIALATSPYIALNSITLHFIILLCMTLRCTRLLDCLTLQYTRLGSKRQCSASCCITRYVTRRVSSPPWHAARDAPAHTRDRARALARRCSPSLLACLQVQSACAKVPSWQWAQLGYSHPSLN